MLYSKRSSLSSPPTRVGASRSHYVNYLFTLHREDFEGEIEFLLEVGMDGVVLSVLPLPKLFP
jgi:hypothetical protein